MMSMSDIFVYDCIFTSNFSIIINTSLYSQQCAASKKEKENKEKKRKKSYD